MARSADSRSTQHSLQHSTADTQTLKSQASAVRESTVLEKLEAVKSSWSGRSESWAGGEPLRHGTPCQQQHLLSLVTESRSSEYLRSKNNPVFVGEAGVGFSEAFHG